MISHIQDMEAGPYWEIQWAAVGNNNAQVTRYNEEEMIDNCIDGDPIGCIQDTNVEQQLTDHIDKLQNLDDFELYVLKQSQSIGKVLDAVIQKCDRHLYLTWIWECFGYGQHDSDHPDALKFGNPFDKSVKLHSNVTFKRGTQFPQPSGASWMRIKARANDLSNLATTN